MVDATQANPFSYSTDTYLFVIILASIAGFVRFLNFSVKTGKMRFVVLLRDLSTGSLAGLMAFWICEYFNLVGPLSNVAVVVAGVMGVRAIDEIKGIVFNILNAYMASKKNEQN